MSAECTERVARELRADLLQALDAAMRAILRGRRDAMQVDAEPKP